MEDYLDYSSSSQAQAHARNSHYSTQSWLQQNQSFPSQRASSIPPPQPLNLPTPVQPLRPLPNPHRKPPEMFRVVNTPAPPTADVNHLLRRNLDSEGTVTSESPQLFSDSSTGDHLRPKKKKSIVRGFVKGIRRLPRSVFGHGAGNAGISQSNREVEGTPAMTGFSPSAMESATTVLPPYRSNPSSPAVAVGPGRSGLSKPFWPHMVNTQPTIPESPPPEVVRLDSRPNSGNLSLRVTPPSGNYDQTTNLYTENQDPHFLQHHASADRLAERTTVMVYNEQSAHYNDLNRPTLPPVSQQRSTSPGLSYISDHVAPLRPTSYHSAHTTVHLPPPTITVSDEVSEATPRPMYASPMPRRVPSRSVLDGAPPISSSVPHSQIQTPPPNQALESVDPAALPAEVTSPMSVHPEPTNDYRKMSLLSSPSPTSHDTLSTATSFYDPSFTSLNAVEKFFKTLYHMPWVSHNRVTVDYLPGEGAHKKRRAKNRPLSSWYHSMFNNSRRSSVTLDLLSNGTGTASSPRSSAHDSLGLALNSQAPLSTRKHRHLSDKPRDSHRSHRHHSSSHHHHRRRHDNHDSRKRHRHTATTTDTNTTGARMQQTNPVKHAISPLVPSVYPFHYPPYPYPSFSAFPVPVAAPAAIAPQSSQTGSRPVTAPRGPRYNDHDPSKQPAVVYGSPTNYAPYQPMIGVPPVYLIPPISPQANNVPTALVPGGVHDGHSHAAPPPAGQQLQQAQQTQQQPQRQPTPAPAIQVTSPSIPGAF